MLENEVRIMSLEGDFLDKSKKLNKADHFTYEKNLRAPYYKEEIKKAKSLASSLQDQMSSLKEHMS